MAGRRRRPPLRRGPAGLGTRRGRGRRVGPQPAPVRPTGWKVQAELPNPVSFEAATAFVTPDDVAKTVAYGPDPQRHLEVARQFAEAGFDHLALLNAGPDPDGFFDFFTNDLADPLRALRPSRGPA